MQEKESTTHCGSPLIVGAIRVILSLHVNKSIIRLWRGEWAKKSGAKLRSFFFFFFAGLCPAPYQRLHLWNMRILPPSDPQESKLARLLLSRAIRHRPVKGSLRRQYGALDSPPPPCFDRLADDRPRTPNPEPDFKKSY